VGPYRKSRLRRVSRRFLPLLRPPKACHTLVVIAWRDSDLDSKENCSVIAVQARGMLLCAATPGLLSLRKEQA